ncbi:MAG: hypothetical protein E7451_05535 [Ruminococcaceae bacterium]|nr:hypothetical protein [Oscillospiraceae bacterium]
MNGMKLFEALSGLDDDLILTQTQEPPVRIHRRLRRLLIAAAAAVLLSITALGIAQGSGRIDLQELDGQTILSFRALDIFPVEVGGWYPTQLPDGYEVYFIGDNADNTQTINFTNGEVGYLQLCFGEVKQMPDYTLSEDAALQNIRIGEHDALLSKAIFEKTALRGGHVVTLQIHTDGLFWIDSQNRLAYALRYQGEDPLDLIPIAESIAPTEALSPTYQDFAKAATVKLGDYAPTWLPEGYQFVSLHGNPVNPLMHPEEQGHVRKVYQNAEHYRIDLFYEYLPDGSASVTDVDPALLTATPARVGDLDAVCYTSVDGTAYAVVWQREDAVGIPLTFTLRCNSVSSGEYVTMEELLKIAESVTLLTPANTAAFDLSIYP